MPAGGYKEIISYAATEAGNRWDAGRFNDPKIISIVFGDVPSEENIEFEFEAKDVIESFEIRTWFGGRGSFSLYLIKVEPKVSLALNINKTRDGSNQ